MGLKKTIFKGFFLLFVLVVLANPIYSETEYNQKISWITGFIFGITFVFVVFLHFKGAIGGNNESRLYDN